MSEPNSFQDYQVGPETWVELEAQVYDAEGELVGKESLGFVFGLAQVFPAIERALEGGVAGLEGAVELEASEAYGERDSSLVRSVAREEFPNDVQEGDRFELEDSTGAILVVRVLGVDAEEVQLDFNHPLAGQRVKVEYELVRVRPASSAEVARAEGALNQQEVQSTHLVQPERLLQGARQGYEDGPLGKR